MSIWRKQRKYLLFYLIIVRGRVFLSRSFAVRVFLDYHGMKERRVKEKA